MFDFYLEVQVLPENWQTECPKIMPAKPIHVRSQEKCSERISLTFEAWWHLEVKYQM